MMSAARVVAILITAVVLGVSAYLATATAVAAVDSSSESLPTQMVTPTEAPPPEAAPHTTSPMASPSASPAPVDDENLFGFLPDPRQWAADVFNQVLTNLMKDVAEALRRVIDSVLGSSLNFITQTPPDGSYASPTVQTLWGIVRLIANAALVLVTLWGGFNLIVRQHLGASYHEALELIPRLLLGALLVNTSLSWGRLAIDANNALCQAIGQASFPAWERAGSGTQLLVDVIASLIYLVTSLLLLLQMLMRLALIDVLLVVAPLGLLCWVLPQTQGWARLWSTTFFSAVFAQFLQVLALKLGGSLLTELTPMAADSALLTVFLGVAVLVLTLKIPGLIRHRMGDGLGFVRYVTYRQGARALEGRRGAGRPGGGA
ncbi:conjugal transfer protein TrbL family protein [Nitrolancea hollandica]|uniref:TrbL/VirB6 plasmid conjugal transfer protein n=1 Tax=Nitrolancea hollandica Lb TaxID=1129897 RepID=I4EM30_9BACT|nr:conjugal transfer protein TrbL family protein [Nitrolancea hollandica]CCF85743.1 membrane hypothetical protein [Nitrolancea hollandica Lb]